MSADRHQRITDLFHAACELSADERQAFLRRECGDDAALLQEVESMLAVDADRPEFLEQPPGLKPAVARPEASSDSLERMLGDLKEQQPNKSRYEIRGEFARGGMGAILRVWDRSLRRTLAMKVVLGDTPAEGSTPVVDDRTLGRFVEEAQITGQLDHPGIVPVYEIGLDTEGQVFFTMRLVKGDDLRAVFDLLRGGEGGWTQTRVLGVILKVCEALAYAHSKGVIHRDLKPANIMVGRFGEAYVMDWGLAHVVGQKDHKDIRPAPADALSMSRVRTDRREDTGADSPLLTMDGDVVGTPAFMSPEQARGDIAAMGPASDVYALGAILYQLLAGHMPYVPTDARLTAHAVWALAQQGPPTPVARLAPRAPAELIAICEQAMAREPKDRYADMTEMAADMRAFVEGRVVQAHRTGALIELKKWIQRNRALATTLLMGLVVVAALGTWSNLKVRAERNLAISERERADTNARQATSNAESMGRLSDVKALVDLTSEMDQLWPAHPQQLQAMLAWTARARDLIGRLPLHEQTLRDLRARGTPGESARPAELLDLRERAAALSRELGQDAEQGQRADKQAALDRLQAELASLESRLERERPLRFDDERDAWWHDTLLELVSGIVAFSGDDPYGATITNMLKRLKFAAAIERNSITYYREEWDRAIKSIADRGECPQYDGLRIRPQIGLVPIGQDPQSGLWEFWHVQTGESPQRAEDGALQLTAETGLVFVLIPGGRFWMGAQSTDPSGQNHDPQASGDESPVHEVTLDAYFLSKYELTQGQWQRTTGANPSVHGPLDKRGKRRATLLHPVEGVSWNDCVAMLDTLALRLPTEAQWEYGCRAGTDSPWWAGTELNDLARAGNLADQYFHADGGPVTMKYEPELNDGFAFHAPVGRFRANAFGLHDVIGNVHEWCQDEYGSYSLATRPGDGCRDVSGTQRRVGRGASATMIPFRSRSARRGTIKMDQRTGNYGARPARAIDS